MKKFIVLLIFTLSFDSFAFAQSVKDEPEKASPMQNAELIRKVLSLDIEGKLYTDVVVAIKSISITSPNLISGNYSEKYRVKVKVMDSDGKTVWNKTMKNVYLYVFSNGQVQVGKPNFDKLVIYSDKRDNKYEKGIIREKEGVY